MRARFSTRVLLILPLILMMAGSVAFAKISSTKKTSKTPATKTAPVATVCINWPKVFEQTSMQRFENNNNLVSVTPIRDDTGVAGDEWLSQGLANLLIRMLNTHSSAGAIPERNTVYLPPEHPVRFKVGGLFQHTQNWLRIFIQLKDPADKLLAQFTIETPYPLHKQFFTGIREAAAGILNKIGTQDINMGALKAIENETDSTRAYENVTKGMQALESYDPNKMEVALIWFQEARREDNPYPAAYRGLMGVYNFLSLYHKANGVPYSADLENAEATMNELAQHGRKTDSQGKNKSKKREDGIDNRFLAAQVHFVLGDRALTQGDAAKAVAELSEAAQLVPEDPVTALSLSEAYEKLGQDKMAGQFRNQAEEINTCLKGK